MSRFFQRHFGWVKLLGIVICTALAGSTTSTLLGLSLLDRSIDLIPSAQADETADDPGDGEPVEDEAVLGRTVDPIVSAAAARTRSRERAIATILGHNPFCPECVPPVATPPAPGGEAVMADAPAGVRSPLPLRLSATMEADDPAASLATIVDLRDGSVGLFGVGDEIGAGIVVTAVRLGRVDVRRGSAIEYIDLGPPPAAPKTVSTGSTKPKDAAKPSPALDALECPSENLCVIERAFVDDVLANPAKFASQAPMVKPDPSGGFVISRVRKGTLGNKLGLQSGDRLLAIDGQDLGGLDQVLALVPRLRSANNLSVTLERKGKTLEKEIQIR